MTHFCEWLGERHLLTLRDYNALHHWSVTHLEQFWEAFWDYSKIRHSGRYERVVDSFEMPGARWFSGVRLNFAENVLARDAGGPAIVAQLETDYQREVSHAELVELVARCSRGLKASGVGPGDHVAGYLANVPEAVIACLACASLGAVWSSASPDFGLDALCDRLEQVEPKLLFASTHYRYGGRTFRTDPVIEKLPGRIPSLETIISVPYPVGTPSFTADLDWGSFLGPDDGPELTFTEVPFDHPLYILFSSGTTGAPKCIVHGTGGVLLQHLKELRLHSNLKGGDFLLYFTTTGWMMWNWQLSALSLGATLGLYDGNPGHPDLGSIWRSVDNLGVTHFGTSGRFLESCRKAMPRLESKSLGDFRSLQQILYTGSSLSKQGFRWVYEAVKPDLQLAGISGGTDIVSCFVLGNPNLPVLAGEIQCKGLGVDVEAVHEDGRPVDSGPGELVCRKPLPSMPIGFLHDADGSKYRRAYFDFLPGLWRHGDSIEFTPHGGAILHGRSDATLNPGGVRIGPAEIYSALGGLNDLKEALAIGWTPPGQSDEIIILFVVLMVGALDDVKREQIRSEIRNRCSPRHVPPEIFQISEIPVTRSGKAVELSVKAVLAGQEVSNRNALANPEVLEECQRIRSQLLEGYKLGT